MKTYLAKLLVSLGLDQGRPLSRFWRKQVSRSSEVRTFAAAAQHLDRLLREPLDQQTSDTPADLHSDIMQAVRANRPQAVRERASGSRGGAALVWRWGFATVLVVLVIAGSWAAWHRHLPSRDRQTAPVGSVGAGSLAGLPSVGSMVEGLATNGVALLNTPMQRQIDDLSQNLRQTAQFLLASLP
jgi:hypothetical protein